MCQDKLKHTVHLRSVDGVGADNTEQAFHLDISNILASTSKMTGLYNIRVEQFSLFQGQNGMITPHIEIACDGLNAPYCLSSNSTRSLTLASVCASTFQAFGGVVQPVLFDLDHPGPTHTITLPERVWAIRLRRGDANTPLTAAPPAVANPPAAVADWTMTLSIEPVSKRE